jgi:hypothetical protein
MINERLMTRADILNYVKLDSLETMREQLCAILNNQLASITNNLTLSQLSLSQALEQHSKSENK